MIWFKTFGQFLKSLLLYSIQSRVFPGFWSVGTDSAHHLPTCLIVPTDWETGTDWSYVKLNTTQYFTKKKKLTKWQTGRASSWLARLWNQKAISETKIIKPTEFLCITEKSFISKPTSTVSKIPVHAKESALSLSAKDLLTMFPCSPRELKSKQEKGEIKLCR